MREGESVRIGAPDGPSFRVIASCPCAFVAAAYTAPEWLSMRWLLRILFAMLECRMARRPDSGARHCMESLISITFDDGLRSQFDKGLPILDDLGLKATFFVIANDLPTHDRYTGLHDNDWWKIDWRADDVAMLKEVVAAGHEIGSHSVSHHPDMLPIQPDIEARESKRLIENWLGIKVLSFCYPFYWSHSCLADAVKDAGYEQARGGGTPPHYGPTASYYSVSKGTSLDRLNVDCRQISPQGENV